MWMPARAGWRGTLAALAAVLALGAPAARAASGRAAGAPVAPLPVSQVAPGVYVHVGRVEDWLAADDGDVANIGFVVGSRCVAVVDTGGSRQVGERLRAAVARATPLPVCYVINTHTHPDHVMGNAAFAQAPKRPAFVGHARLAAALQGRAPYYLAALQRERGESPGPAAIVPPDTAVERALELDLGGRVLELRAWPTAHTDNDLTVYDRSTRTLFASDLLFVEHLPVVDGSLRGWLSVLDALGALDVAVAVPGHGPVQAGGWPAPLAAQRRYLEALRRDTRAAIKAGATLQEAVGRIAPDASARWALIDLFHRRNVTAAYAELEWED